MITPARITVLISGKGTNLKALIQQDSAYLVTNVISNKIDAGGLDIARLAGIPTTVVERAKFTSQESFKDALLTATKASEPGFIVLAGFMVLLPPSFIAAFPGRILNIHPSLLPSFPGLNTHQRALDANAPRHGCTVHLVDDGMDTGPLIAQAGFEVEPSDSVESLAAKTQQREHALYPWVLGRVALGEITIDAHGARCSDTAREQARRNGFTLCC